MTSAQKQFLTNFMRPRSVKEFEDSSRWEVVLGEKPTRTIERMVKAGLLSKLGTAETLESNFTAVQLKDLLRKHGHATAGRKSQLATRLVQVAPQEMLSQCNALTSYACTEMGAALARRHLESVQQFRKSVELDVVSALRNREFENASRLVAAFESQQVFSRGINVDWKNHAPDADTATLTVMFETKPKILAALSEDQMEQLRVAAGMLQLWGSRDYVRWLPCGFKTGLVMDDDAAVRMIYFHAIHVNQMKQFRQLDKLGMAIATFYEIPVIRDGNSCEACSTLANRQFKLNEIPELPFEKCTSPLGCRCMAIAKFDLV